MSGEMDTCVKCDAVLFYDDEKVLIRTADEVNYITTAEQGHLAKIHCVACATKLFDAAVDRSGGHDD